MNLKHAPFFIFLFFTVEVFGQQRIEKEGTNWFLYGLYAVILIWFIIYIRKASKNQAKNGINLKTVYCPNCNEKQPFIRLPKNISQALYGGTTCPKCGTELDKYGNII
ncbi:hypothetical protein [Pedobacter sp.]|uniref:hypothetical protein n=1 Tax=Pedobacter sp. TaxID=1411316 RepID=UPI0031D42E94